MRTTIRLPDDLMQRLRQHAARTNQTMTQVIEDAIRKALAGKKERAAARPTRLTTVGGDGLYPGVDLDDSADLLDRMETAEER